MTEAPLALSPKALVTDVLHLMVERGIGHVPIVEDKTGFWVSSLKRT